MFKIRWLNNNIYISATHNYKLKINMICSDLPHEVLSTPMGQMLAPMIQQMTPRGNSIPFTMGDAIERNGKKKYIFNWCNHD